MKHITYTDPKSKKIVHRVELTAGEQYDLMKRNRAALESTINWQKAFESVEVKA